MHSGDDVDPPFPTDLDFEEADADHTGNEGHRGPPRRQPPVHRGQVHAEWVRCRTAGAGAREGAEMILTLGRKCVLRGRGCESGC